MPSTIAPVELTRAFCVKPAKGLRYGNFEGVVHLPPVSNRQSLGEHSFSQLNNQQIYKTICEWFQGWRPWQQDLLLSGIANRCSPRQLDILATTLEPVRHRDYSTVCNKRYPSASFQKDIVPKNIPLKTAMCKAANMVKSDGMGGSRGSTRTDKLLSRERSSLSSKQAATKPRSKHFKKKILLSEDSSVIGRLEKSKTSLSNKSTLADKQRSEKNKQSEKHKQSEKNKQSSPLVSNSTSKTASSNKSLPDDRPASVQNSHLSDKHSAPNKKEQFEKAVPPSTVDEYAMCLSAHIIKSAIQTVAAAYRYDKTLYQTETSSENTVIHNIETDEMMNILKPCLASITEVSDTALQTSPAQNTVTSTPSDETTPAQNTVTSAPSDRTTPAQNIVSSAPSDETTEKSCIFSTTASASFLGGRLQIKTESAKSLQSGRGLQSASSQFRHNVFTASSVSTAAFFCPSKIERFGSPLCEIAVESVHHMEGLSGVPISLAKTFQHHKWWRGRSMDGSFYALRKPNHKELSTNFKDQLGHVWEWLQQWEDFERIALLKEVVKLASPTILSSLVTNIHQKMRDQLDMNRLPDKLILLILSFLPPQQINLASQVCRRWRFLTASDELWMLKCLEMGEMEGVENIPKLVLDAHKSDRVVDWKQAFYELRLLIHIMKDGLSRPTDIHFGSLYSPSDGPLPVETITELNMKQVTDSYMQTADGDDDGKVADVGDVSDDDVSLDEDLSLMLGEYSLLSHEPDQLDSTDRSYLRRRRKISQKKNRGDIADQSVILEETIKEESPLKDIIKSKRKGMSSGDEEEDEKGQDIRPKLEQAFDLLGKIVPATTLEWQTPEDETNTQPKTTTFAGLVKSVNRVRKLQGHMSGIVCVNFDKKRLVTGGMDRTVRIWDIRSGTSIHKFCGHKGGIRCLEFDDDILASGSWDTLIVLWDMRQFTKITGLVGHDGCVSALQINKRYIVSGSHDNTIRVWCRLTFYCCHIIKTHTGAVNSLMLDGDFVLSSSSDMTLCMSSIDTGRCVRVFDAVHRSILSLVIANNLVIGGDQTGTIYFWNKSTGESEAAIRAHDAPVYKVTYGNGRFWTASGDHTVKEWDLMTLTCVRALQGHKGSVRDVKVSQERAVSCSDDGTIRIWDFQTSKTCKK